MTTWHIDIGIGAPPDEVWADLSHIESHVEWMADAERIDILTAAPAGVGTRFDCVTKVGPIRLTDRMELTRWEPPHTMAVSHRGVVTGHGTFALSDGGDGTTNLRWTETLRFPWWLGGPLGERVAQPILNRIWNGNLRRFAARFPPR